MKKYTFMQGLEVRDKDGMLVSKLGMNVSFTGNENDSKEDVRKIQGKLIDVVEDFMSSIE